MLTFLMIGRHTPAECALFNEKSAKLAAAWISKLPELEAKHGVKMVGGWTVHSEHLTVTVWEAPSIEALQAYSMEPEVANVANVETAEVKMAMPFEETGRMIQQMMQQK